MEAMVEMADAVGKAVAVDRVPAYASVVTVVRVEVAQEAGMVARAAT